MRLSTLQPGPRVWKWLDRPSRDVFFRILLINLAVVALTLLVGCPLGDLKRRPLGVLTPFHALFSAEIVCTAVSFVQLWLSGWVLREVYQLRRGQLLREDGRAGAARVWLLMCAGFFYLAVDEVAFLHEGLGKLPLLLGLPKTPLTIRLDDFIPVGYALAGLGVLAWYREELGRYRKFWKWVAAGMVIGLLSVGLDVGTHRKDFLRWCIADPAVADFWWGKLNALEEGCKVLAEATFLGMFLACRETVRRDEEPPGDTIPFPTQGEVRRVA